MTGAIDALAVILQSVPARLGDISDSQAAHRSAPGHWSRKEILGHLIDSATNNHQRLVRAQLVPRLDFPSYEQESWVALQAYATEPWADLVNLWLLLNRHMLHIVRGMPDTALAHEIALDGRPPVTLSALFADYLSHLNHHLDQILAPPGARP